MRDDRRSEQTKRGGGSATVLVLVAAVLLAATWVGAGGPRAAIAQDQPQSCAAEDFSREVDATGAAMRSVNQDMTPELDKKLQALKAAKGWSDANLQSLAQDYLYDARTAALDQKANALLDRFEELGSGGESGEAECAKLAELRATGVELLAVMKAKSAYTLEKIDREIAAARGGSAGQQARADLRLPDAAVDDLLSPPPSRPAAPRPSAEDAGQTAATAADRTVEPAEKAAAAGKAGDAGTASASRPAEALRGAVDDGHNRQAAKGARDTREAAVDREAREAREARAEAGRGAPPREAAKRPSDTSDLPWRTTTEATPPPSEGPPPPEEGYTGGDLAATDLPLPPEGSGPRLPSDTFAGPDEGYTVEEIRDATRGFFGTVSTNLGTVIEHAFSNWGRPTAYVLGKEGGGAFLAGVRYGKGTLFMRSGASRQVFWTGPSLGYDFGAEGSRTLFLIYDLAEPDALYRRFTGVDGSAYLVGGVGVTLLKGGPIVLAPIRSGLGLRLGANIGYVRFTPEPTWNPF